MNNPSNTLIQAKIAIKMSQNRPPHLKCANSNSKQFGIRKNKSITNRSHSISRNQSSTQKSHNSQLKRNKVYNIQWHFRSAYQIPSLYLTGLPNWIKVQLDTRNVLRWFWVHVMSEFWAIFWSLSGIELVLSLKLPSRMPPSYIWGPCSLKSSSPKAPPPKKSLQF